LKLQEEWQHGLDVDPWAGYQEGLDVDPWAGYHADHDIEGLEGEAEDDKVAAECARLAAVGGLQRLYAACIARAADGEAAELSKLADDRLRDLEASMREISRSALQHLQDVAVQTQQKLNNKINDLDGLNRKLSLKIKDLQYSAHGFAEGPKVESLSGPVDWSCEHASNSDFDNSVFD